jgi:hypothetical protein
MISTISDVHFEYMTVRVGLPHLYIRKDHVSEVLAVIKGSFGLFISESGQTCAAIAETM